jgi:predicted enzyme related to lactoylglutathione lyase
MSGEHLEVKIQTVCMDAADPEKLGQWWQSLLGGTLSLDSDGDVRLAAGDNVPLLFLGVPEGKTVKNRLHLDLQVTDFDRAVDRVLELGATAADDVYRGDGWRVFRDPEGNEFCVLRPDPGA